MEKVVFNQLTIEVTRRCNMACGHCLRGDAENIDLTNMDIDSVLDQTEAIGRLIVTGGEPLLNLRAIQHFANGIARRGIPLADFIAENGPFYCECSIRTGNADGKHYQLWPVILSINEDISYQEAERQNPKVLFTKPVQIGGGWTDEAERDFIEAHEVIDCGYSKINTENHPSSSHYKGRYAQDINGDMMVSVDRSIFYTGGDRGLYDVLHQLCWSISKTSSGKAQAVVIVKNRDKLSMGAGGITMGD